MGNGFLQRLHSVASSMFRVPHPLHFFQSNAGTRNAVNSTMIPTITAR